MFSRETIWGYSMASPIPFIGYIRMIRAKYNKIRKAVKRFSERNMTSSAVNKILTLTNGDLYIRNDMSLSELREYNRLADAFLNSETSTITGAKKAEANRRKGFDSFIRGLGYEGNTDNLWAKLSQYDINQIMKEYEYDSNDFFLDMVIAEERGQLDYFMERFAKY